VTARFSYSTHVRCPDPEGQKCPRLWRRDGSWNSRHGSAGWAARIPAGGGGTRLVRRFGHGSMAAAHAEARHAGELLALAGSDARLRARIGDLIAGAKRGQPLPETADVQRRLGLGLDPGSPGLTVAEWLDQWLAQRRAIRPSTERGYRQHVATWLVPHLGHLPLERLNAGHISAMFDAIGQANAELERQRAEGRALITIEGDVRSQPRPVGPSTQRRIMATLRAALNAAVRQRQIMFNPAAGVELAPEKPPEAPRWSAAEAARFIAFTAPDPLGLMFRLAVLCGLRRGELVGLRWAGADTDAGTLLVDHSITELDGHLVAGEPKTAAGVRRVWLDAETARLLREHRKAQLADRMRAGSAWQDGDLVFTRHDGSPWRPGYVTRRFGQLAGQAGVPVITLHQGGRHSANSLMRDAGVDQELRMRAIGHAGRAVNDRYTHVLDEAHREAAEQVAGLVRRAGSVS
jgi:integrase